MEFTGSATPSSPNGIASMKSLAECREICRMTSLCTAISFMSSAQMCYTFYSVSAENQNSSIVSQEISCPKSPCTSCLQVNFASLTLSLASCALWKTTTNAVYPDTFPLDIITSTSNDPTVCMGLCEATVGCSQFFTGATQCEYQSVASETTTTSTGRTALQSLCPSPGSPGTALLLHRAS